MKISLFLTAMCLFCISCDEKSNVTTAEDPFIWLETRQGDSKVENWILQENTRTADRLNARDRDAGLYLQLFSEAKKVYDDNSASNVSVGLDLKNGNVHLFSTDAAHPLGVLKRMSLVDYCNNVNTWEELLDIADLYKKEGKLWIPREYTSQPPNHTRCLMTLTLYNQSKSVIREFDMTNKKFLKPEDPEQGFYLENIDSFDWVKWLSENTLLVLTYLGEDSVTDLTKFPRILKKWTRGTAFADAQTIFTGAKTLRNLEYHVVSHNVGTPAIVLVASRLSSTEDKYALVDTANNNNTNELPLSANFQYQGDYNGNLLFVLQNQEPDLPQIETGSLVAIPVADALVIKDWSTLQGKISKIWEPGAKETFQGAIATKQFLFLHILDNINARMLRWDGTAMPPNWQTVSNVPTQGAMSIPKYKVRGGDVIFAEHVNNQQIFVIYQDFLTPQTVYLTETDGLSMKKLRSMPDNFDASKFEVQQFSVASVDGTGVPYYVVSPKSRKRDGSSPTLMYGYGGWGEAETPYYRGTLGKLWLERGGLYVSANIRGGGEFGPKWHLGAVKENRHKTYEDFISIAEDLIRRGVTSPAHLGIKGVSNGGNLVGSVFVLRTQLFNALICEVGVLDMVRFKIIGGETFGAAYTAEFCDPDESSQAYRYLARYSPYHNIQLRSTLSLSPIVYLSTRTDDYNVHPGHSRKMHAKLCQAGYDTYFWEDPQGGHSGPTTNDDKARHDAMEFYFLITQLMGK